MTLALSPLMRLVVEVGAPVDVDPGPPGRRFIPIVGGTVEGTLTGRVVPGGGDWQDVWPDGRLEISAHYTLEIDSHGLVEVQSNGVRNGPPEVLAALGRGEDVDPKLYYFRTAMRFRTAAPELARLNGIIAVAIGQREAGCVRLEVLELG